MPKLQNAKLMDYTSNWPQVSLMEQLLIKHKIIPAVSHDTAKTSGTKDINLPLQA